MAPEAGVAPTHEPGMDIRQVHVQASANIPAGANPFSHECCQYIPPVLPEPHVRERWFRQAGQVWIGVQFGLGARRIQAFMQGA